MQLSIFKPKTKVSARERILRSLRQAGHYGLQGHELNRICMSWHRRITDLRQDGFVIDRQLIKGGNHRYTLRLEGLSKDD